MPYKPRTAPALARLERFPDETNTMKGVLFLTPTAGYSKIMQMSTSRLPKPKKLPSGSWRLQITVNGKRKSITCRTKDECIREYMLIKCGVSEPEDSPERITLSQAVDIYIEDKQNVLSPSTIRGYRTIQKHRFHRLMCARLPQITHQMLQRAVNEEAREVSAKTLKNAYGLVRTVLEDNGIHIDNVSLPQVQRPRKAYIQPEDFKRLAKAAEGDDCEVPILLAVVLGLRRSEIFGLCWDCVKDDRILIRRSLVPDESNRWVLKDVPKNISSQRDLPVPAELMKKIQAIPRDGDRVFHVHPDTFRRHLHAVCKKAGITDTTPHGLRHTNAAIMRAAGISDDIGMKRGGWSNLSTYQGMYSYVFDQDEQNAADKIADLFL